MSLSTYFEEKTGLGVLSTADRDGVVNSALYSRPHVMDAQTVAFIMTNRKSHENLQSNPFASYLFREDGDGYHGKRLSLRKLREEQDPQKLDKFRRRTYSDEAEDRMKPLSLVYFRVEEERPLVGEA